MVFFKIIKNKYLLTLIALVTWLLFFDKNDVFSQYELIEKCNKLQKEKNYYIAEIENNRNNLHELQTNKKNLETLSRERYLMKKDNEDVYIIVSR